MDGAWLQKLADFKNSEGHVCLYTICNCIHYDFLLVCFIKLIKPLWFFPLNSRQVVFNIPHRKAMLAFPGFLSGAADGRCCWSSGRGHLPSAGWVWGGATVGAHLALLAAVTAPALIVLPFPSPAVQSLLFCKAWFEKDCKPARGMKGIASVSGSTGREVTCIWHVFCVIPEAKPLEDLPKDSVS